MTTIAYRGHTICCDSLVLDDSGANVQTAVKIGYKKCGEKPYFFGSCGNYDLCLMAKAHFIHSLFEKNKSSPMIPFDYQTYNEVGMMIIDVQEKRLINPYTLTYEDELRYGFLAIGSGSAFASGAMFNGTTAKKALITACELDSRSSYPIFVYRANGEFETFHHPSHHKV